MDPYMSEMLAARSAPLGGWMDGWIDVPTLRMNV